MLTIAIVLHWLISFVILNFENLIKQKMNKYIKEIEEKEDLLVWGRGGGIVSPFLRKEWL
jgi:hypothetical protein